MNRRGFLGLLAGTAAVSTTSYFLAPIGGWSSNVIARAPWPPASELDAALAKLNSYWEVVKAEHARLYMEAWSHHYGFDPMAGWKYIQDPRNDDRLTYKGLARS